MRKSISKRVLCFICSFGCLVGTNLFLTGCNTAKGTFNPNKAYSRQQLQQDYALFRKILEDGHPSLYWYTPKDSMNYYFAWGYQHLRDSMTEPDFRTVLSYVISKINCGHTSVKNSKQYSRYLDTSRLPQFPLGIKFWDDTAAVYLNINRKDSLLTRGTIITGINHLPISTIRDSLFRYLVTDGFSINHKYQSLSNLGNFGYLYQAVFGAATSFNIDYLDSSGVEKNTNIKLYDIRKDTSFRRFVGSLEKVGKKKRRQTGLFNTRNIQVDTAGSTAYMTVTTFSSGNSLRPFFRNSFRILEKTQIKNLVIDVRSNGGGNVGISNRFIEYLIDHNLKLTDSLYAIRRLSHFEKYIQNTLAAFFIMNFTTRKKRDGHYHFGYFERHVFKPKSKYHFNGKVYIITGGNSFSATTLFVNAVKGQSNVLVMGEETGGAAYGNTSWFIPDATLPNTGVRFRLPRFRVVMNKDFPKNGRGIVPDVEIKPSVDAIRKGYDVKLEFVKKLIYSDKLKH